MLEFKSDGSEAFPMERKTVEDREHDISNKSLNKLNEVAGKIGHLKQLDVIGDMCDGPSFECLVYLSNGTIRGFHYCFLMPSEKIQEFEDLIRKIVKEDFFLPPKGACPSEQ